MAISFNNGKCPSRDIQSASINADGELIVIYSDSTADNLGKVVGTDGKDFKPDADGTIVPTGASYVNEPSGFVYQSYAGSKVTLYFKTNVAGAIPSTWVSAEYGKGDKGDPFTLDATGAVLPAVATVPVGYSFYNTTDGNVYQKQSSGVWSSPWRWKGEKGEKGNFVVNDQGDTLPNAGLYYDGYTFYNTSTGTMNFVNVDGNGTLFWSVPVKWKGDKGEKGTDGAPGSSAQSLYVVSNTVDFSMPNTLLVLGTIPAGFVVTAIEANVVTALNTSVVELEIRFGGTAQDSHGSVVIAPHDYFDLNNKNRYIIDEINHVPSINDQIVSAVFDYAPSNSDMGIVEIHLTVAKQMPIIAINI